MRVDSARTHPKQIKRGRRTLLLLAKSAAPDQYDAIARLPIKPQAMKKSQMLLMSGETPVFEVNTKTGAIKWLVEEPTTPEESS